MSTGPNWKGGKHKHNGYIFIYCPSHPFRNKDNYVFEHRLVMEQWLREHCPGHPALIEINGMKYLKSKWIPHHKNGVPDDNRIENLKLMTNSEHSSLHHKGKQVSEATKEKISLANKGRHHTDDAKKRISINLKIYIATHPDHRTNISLISKKRWGNPEYKQRLTEIQNKQPRDKMGRFMESDLDKYPMGNK